ncbi:polymer-forming cytoskeletal protein [Pedobacter frigiditerrae]|uniref:Polymer-forming cytoskeletal protein n=1 Tax=Pedobacter frigiditerrae TaxID=2530452 RepID=A0A4R0N4Y6_9SPHI|nr:polymer-forming cytoskeletal protein [Pedobacter frigiditerrae]TCC94447.1 polymer-forming cytoskeletal protein [Pedobacter frigiditerrae]
MFKRNKQTEHLDINQQEISTLIGIDITITGELIGNSVIRVDGKIFGNVKTDKGIVLGEQGVIEGNIDTKSAIIYGTVNGNVKVQQLEIKKTGKVNGDIKTETLEIELGANYNGKLEMKHLIKTEDKITLPKS